MKSYRPLDAEHETPPASCPGCGHVVDRASGIDTALAPTEGDISLCISCGYLALFTAERTLRPPTDAELAEIRAAPGWATIQRARQGIAMWNPNRAADQ